MRNGYFKLVFTENESYVSLFPHEDGGDPIQIDELRDYLVSKGFPGVDIVELKKIVDNLTKQQNLKIASKKGIACPESFRVIISSDRMSAVCRFFPPSTGGAELTPADIKSTLKLQGVTMGVDDNAINAYLADRHYCTDYELAKGLEPTSGKDASIEYFFNTNPNLKPKLNEDGSVDFFSLSAISLVKAGDKLAHLTREEPGEAGYNVTGDKLPPREVKKLTLKFGRNIELSEDELTITSLVNGHASLVEGKVFVSDVYQVSDVDTSTGNIEYNGNVCVLGNVKTGFSVKAQGDVEVRGVVENAVVEATGNVSIARGMNGMSKGTINAGGNVVAKFLENANVNAGGYVHAEAILHSNIICKGDVTVTGKKGFITGGVIRTPSTVSAKTIGSTMGVDTEIEVGTDPRLTLKMNSLNNEIATLKKRIEQSEPVLVTITGRVKAGEQLRPEQTIYFKQLSQQYKEMKEELNRKLNEANDLMEAMDGETDKESCVKVENYAYPGTKITISETSIVLSKPVQHGRFVRDGADIRVKGL
ncbi:MAG: FapA family protein [Lachnospiraceae bacterium]|nr:FapA family protein [Lachnospiraceae bacterium]